MPIQVMHGKLPILGFRIGKLTYITDMKTIDDGELKYLEGTELLVVNALRFDKPHHSHQLMNDAIAFAQKVGAKRTLIIHVCHDVGLHEEVNKCLPQGIDLAYDGQEIYL
jgi:phosphoribosyl 1,2-cyclic phosphate phosphodiesterase